MKIVLQMGILARNYHFQISSQFEKSNPVKVSCKGFPQTVILSVFVGKRGIRLGDVSPN